MYFENYQMDSSPVKSKESKIKKVEKGSDSKSGRADTKNEKSSHVPSAERSKFYSEFTVKVKNGQSFDTHSSGFQFMNHMRKYINTEYFDFLPEDLSITLRSFDLATPYDILCVYLKPEALPKDFHTLIIRKILKHEVFIDKNKRFFACIVHPCGDL